jgi:hypothetical protein
MTRQKSPIYFGEADSSHLSFPEVGSSPIYGLVPDQVIYGLVAGQIKSGSAAGSFTIEMLTRANEIVGRFKKPGDQIAIAELLTVEVLFDQVREVTVRTSLILEPIDKAMYDALYDALHESAFQLMPVMELIERATGNSSHGMCSIQGKRPRSNATRTGAAGLIFALEIEAELMVRGEQANKTNLLPICEQKQSVWPDRYGGCKPNTLRAAYYDVRPRFRKSRLWPALQETHSRWPVSLWSRGPTS